LPWWTELWLATVRLIRSPRDNRGVATAAIAPPVRGARLTLPFACAGFGALTALAVVPRTSPPTTYGAASAAAAVVGLGAGFALLAAAAATSLVRPRRSIALVTAMLGVTWLANDWIGWDGGPPIARSIAMVLVPFLVPFLVHLTLAYPAGRMPGVSAWVVALVYGATAVVSVGHASSAIHSATSGAGATASTTRSSSGRSPTLFACSTTSGWRR
jgi:hypothetical protein